MAHDRRNLNHTGYKRLFIIFFFSVSRSPMFPLSRYTRDIFSIEIESKSHQISFSLPAQLEYITQKVFCVPHLHHFFCLTFIFFLSLLLFVLSSTVMMREHISCHCHVPNACCSNNMIYQIITWWMPSAMYSYLGSCCVSFLFVQKALNMSFVIRFHREKKKLKFLLVY